MASVKVEIYVSRDDVTYTKLDLYKNEKITIKYLRKDTQNLAKVSAPFSQGFSIEATPKNCQALGYFGNTDINRSAGSNILKCKIYIDGFLNNIGVFKIEGVKYKARKMSSFNVSFNSNILSIKDRMADDTLQDLSSAVIPWSPDNVYNRLKTVGTVTADGVDVKYYCPLISNNRVLSYSTTEDFEDNIRYISSHSPYSTRVLNTSELQPCVSIVSLFSLIKNKYSLNVNFPLESKPELKDLYVWCNASQKEEESTISKLKLYSQFSNGSTSLTTVADLSDSSVVLSTTNPLFVKCFIGMDNIIIGDGVGIVTLYFVDKITGDTKYQRPFEFFNGNTNRDFILPEDFFDGGTSNFYLYLESSKRISWRNFSIGFRLTSDLSPVQDLSTPNLNSADTALNHYDLIKGLPKVKVIDFLTSLLKTFNISIFDSSINDDKLDFLTLEDINDPIEVYGKRTLDYTRYNVDDVDKKTLDEYNAYNFKHKTSKYKSNVDFKNAFGVEYGQTLIDNSGTEKRKEYKVETEFSIIPPVRMNGLNSVVTAYGFSSELPEIEDNKVRYTPNYDELTLFYNNGQGQMSSLGCQNRNSSGIIVNSQLNRYQKTLPYNINSNTLAFSILVDNGIEYPNSLYLRYYSEQTIRLLKANSLEHSFTLELPTNELYLNENINFSPTGFRLQNDIIIGDQLFDILEANIDMTTGKTKITLLNK